MAGRYGRALPWQQRLTRREALLFSGAAAGGLVVACSSSNNNNNTGAKPTTGAAPTQTAVSPAATPRPAAASPGAAGTQGAAGSPQAAATLTPKKGGTIKLYQGTSDATNEDVQSTPLATVGPWGPGIAYSRLLKTKLVPEVPELTVVIEGDAAASWEQVDDVTMTFKLQPNAKWHNVAPVNGRPLVADDIVYSIKRQFDLKANAGFLGYIDHAVSVDPTTLRIVNKQPDADFLVSLPDTRNVIVPHEVVEQAGDLRSGPTIGTGAWIHTEWVKGSVQRFSRNPAYFIPDRPYADRLEVYLITDVSSQKAAITTKNVTAPVTTGPTFSPAETKNIQGQASFLATVSARTFTGGFVLLHADQGATKDVRVRQAISKALDRAGVIQTVYGGAGWMSPGLTVPLDWLLSDDEVKQRLGQDLTGARQLMQAAGVSSVDYKMLVQGQASTDAGALLQQALKQIGVNITLSPVTDFAALTIAQTQGQFETALIGYGALPTNQDLVARWRTGGSRNGGGLSDPTLDKLIDTQAALLNDKNQRKTMLQDIQRRIIDAAVWVPLYSGLPTYLYDSSLKNYGATNIVAEYGQYEKMWLS